MTFEKLKKFINQLDEEQLKETVELRCDLIVELELAQTTTCVPFFTYQRAEGDDGE